MFYQHTRVLPAASLFNPRFLFLSIRVSSSPSPSPNNQTSIPISSNHHKSLKSSPTLTKFNPNNSLSLPLQNQTIKIHIHPLFTKTPKSILLPNPAKTNIHEKANWLYGPAAIEEEVGAEQEHGENPQFTHTPAEPRVEDQPSSSFNMHSLQLWCDRIELEQQRQGEEQIRQGQVLDNLSTMMQDWYTQYSAPPPPPGQP